MRIKQYGSFVKKEFYHILRDTRTIVILLLMPVVQIILFGFAISTEIRNIDIAIFDQSKDGVSQKLVQNIAEHPYFSLVYDIQRESEIEQLFRKNVTTLVLVIPNNFEKSLKTERYANLQVLADATDPNEANTSCMYLSRLVGEFSGQFTAMEIPVINVNSHMLYNPELKSAYDFVPGVMALIMIIVCAMMTSISIVKEKESGTMELLLVSQIRPVEVILAKITPYFIFSMLNIATILVLAKFMLGIPIILNSLPLIFLISTAYVIVALSLGLLISTITDTQQVALLVSLLGLMLPNLLLSGMIFPRENMPFILQIISNVTPATWYITMLKDVMIKNMPFMAILKPFLILLGMALLFIVISLKKFKTRLE